LRRVGERERSLRKNIYEISTVPVGPIHFAGQAIDSRSSWPQEDILKQGHLHFNGSASKLCGVGEEGQAGGGWKNHSPMCPPEGRVHDAQGHSSNPPGQCSDEKWCGTEKKNAEDLLKLYEMHWGEQVSTKVLQLAQEQEEGTSRMNFSL
jgi:hypothetical protein